MLIGDGWAFVHIPKTGGTSIRAALRSFSSREAGDVDPMRIESSTNHRFHRVTARPPEGLVFAVVRHPVAWLRSYWAMRLAEGRRDHRKVLDELWAPDLDEFGRRVIQQRPGYVSRLFRAYAGHFPGTQVHRLEDGLQSILESFGVEWEPHRNPARSNLPHFAPEIVAALETVERRALDRYGYRFGEYADIARGA